jgi:hypothetical protein
MPEEIQVWLFHTPGRHLLAVNLLRLEARAASRCDKAEAWLSRGNFTSLPVYRALDIQDMARGLVINHRLLTQERQAGLYADLALGRNRRDAANRGSILARRRTSRQGRSPRSHRR